jgi:subtilisin family serine protease
VGLPTLLRRTSGIQAIGIALIDGPVAVGHPLLANDNIRVLTGAAACSQADSLACRHGTLVAGVLHARRDATVPGICPGCTLIVRPVFSEGAALTETNGLPSATLAEVTSAILEAVKAGARIINLSIAPTDQGPGSEDAVEQALNAAARRGILVVAASGNQGTLGSSVITRHPWVIPVVACDGSGVVSALFNLGASIGRNGLAAPGEDIESLAATGGTATFSGTSAAVPLVTGTLGLLWSLFPATNAASLRLALVGRARRRSVTPPLLNAAAAYETLAAMQAQGTRH